MAADAVILLFKYQITDPGIVFSALMLLTAGSLLSGGDFNSHPPRTLTS